VGRTLAIASSTDLFIEVLLALVMEAACSLVIVL
jgi:hypothetical protein